MCSEPVFIMTVATSCAGMSVCIERITARSSTCAAIAENTSLTSMPDFPYFANLNGDAIATPLRPGKGLVVVLRQLGLGIPGVHLRRRALRENVNDVFRFCREVCRLARRSGALRSREQFVGEKARQAERTESHAATGKELSPVTQRFFRSQSVIAKAVAHS